MRYTTAQFGEVIFLLGEFAEARSFGDIQIQIFDLTASGLPVTLTTSGCFEVPGSNAGGFSTYAWSSDNVYLPTTEATQYLYKMTDLLPANGRVQKGKFTVGGHPDDSARSRYGGQVHITPDGGELPTVATMSTATLNFTSGNIQRTTGNFTSDGFRAGQYVQIDNTTVNNGVFGTIVAISGASSNNLGFASGTFFTETAVVGTSLVAKRLQFDFGTEENPVNNLMDARQIATQLRLHQYHLRNGMYLTIHFPHDNWSFFGDDPDAEGVEFCCAATTDGCSFEQIGIFGDLAGRIVTSRCIIGAHTGTVTGLEGVFNDTGTAGTIQIAPGGTMTGLQIASRNLFGTQLDFSAGTCIFLGGSVLGLWTIKNMSGADICGMAVIGSVITFDATNSGGIAQIGGVGEMNIANSVGTTITDQLVRGSRIDEYFSNLIPFVAS